MVPVLNDVGTMCAVFGNHDFGMVNFYFIFSACKRGCSNDVYAASGVS